MGGLDRRELLVGGAALALVRPAFAAQPLPPALWFDFTQGLPQGVRFERAGPAMADVVGGGLRRAAAHEPRAALDPDTGQTAGLLIEGTATNFARNAFALSSHTWQIKGTAVSALMPDIAAPNGTPLAARLRLRQQAGDLGVIGGGGPIAAGEITTFSIYLRALGEGTEWALNLIDFGTRHGHFERVQLTPTWRRISFSMHWDARDISNKLMNIAAARPEWPAESIHEALAWGCQLEIGRTATSVIPTDLLPLARAADVVTFDAASLARPAGLLRLVLPRGGVRGGTLLDTDGGGVRLAYNDSGWLQATVGAQSVSGSTDVTGDRVVELAWGPAGVILRTGTADALQACGAVAGRTGPILCGATARLFAKIDGSAPLNAVLASVRLEPLAGALPIAAAAAKVSFVPAGYKLTFGDDFDNDNTRRINETAVGGRPGAPAWRSRLPQDRLAPPPGERQIYVDPAFTGTGETPLGVEPFAIHDGVLTLTAAMADPTTVAPSLDQGKFIAGCISGELTHWQTYGFIEIRARLPIGRGVRSVVRLLPKAPHGKAMITLLEADGERPTAVRVGAAAAGVPMADHWVEDVIAVADGFHVYGIEWTREQLAWFIDGKQVWRQTNSANEDLYLFAGLVVPTVPQRRFPEPDETAGLPARFDIDYIRLYRKS